MGRMTGELRPDMQSILLFCMASSLPNGYRVSYTKRKKPWSSTFNVAYVFMAWCLKYEQLHLDLYLQTRDEEQS
jgi:hypothetical protein